MPTTRQGLNPVAIEQLIAQRLLMQRQHYDESITCGNGVTMKQVKVLEMESVFHICNCAENLQVKYATCTLLDGSLTWWNSNVQSVGLEAAYETTWKEQMMTDEYCTRNEELALLCPTMVSPKYKKIKRYIWGLTDDIQGNVTSSKSTRIQEAICMAHDLMNQAVRYKAANGG
ncbi:hypothetical protein Tco_0411329 [Tanacetum coccineum]